MSVLNQDTIWTSSEDVDVFSLDNILSSMNVSDSGLTVISERELGPDMQLQYKCKKRFHVFVWKQLSKVHQDYRGVVSLSLLKREYGFTYVESCLKLLREYRSSVLLISILGINTNDQRNSSWGSSWGGKDVYSCIGCLLCFKEKSFFILSHLTVSNFNFSKQRYGIGSDGLPFRGRGLGKVMIGVCQYYIHRLMGSTTALMCYPHQQNNYSEKCGLWHDLGFTSSKNTGETLYSRMKQYICRGGYNFIRGPMEIVSPVNKFHLSYIIDTSAINVSTKPQQPQWGTGSKDKAISFSDKAGSYSAQAQSHTPRLPNNLEVDINVYLEQLSSTIVRIETLPSNVYSRKEQSYISAVQYACDAVTEAYNKLKKQAEEDSQSEGDDSQSGNENWVETYNLSSDNDEEEIKKKRQEDEMLSEVKRFVKGLESNLVFDLGFRSNNEKFQHCWCPCGKSMKPWREKECLDTCSFDRCEGGGGKGFSPQGLKDHVRSKKHCLYHLGVEKVLIHLYDMKKGVFTSKKAEIEGKMMQQYKHERLSSNCETLEDAKVTDKVTKEDNQSLIVGEVIAKVADSKLDDVNTSTTCETIALLPVTVLLENVNTSKNCPGGDISYGTVAVSTAENANISAIITQSASEVVDIPKISENSVVITETVAFSLDTATSSTLENANTSTATREGVIDKTSKITPVSPITGKVENVQTHNFGLDKIESFEPVAVSTVDPANKSAIILSQSTAEQKLEISAVLPVTDEVENVKSSNVQTPNLGLDDVECFGPVAVSTVDPANTSAIILSHTTVEQKPENTAVLPVTDEVENVKPSNLRTLNLGLDGVESFVPVAFSTVDPVNNSAIILCHSTVEQKPENSEVLTDTGEVRQTTVEQNPENTAVLPDTDVVENVKSSNLQTPNLGLDGVESFGPVAVSTVDPVNNSEIKLSHSTVEQKPEISTVLSDTGEVEDVEPSIINQHGFDASETVVVKTVNNTCTSATITSSGTQQTSETSAVLPVTCIVENNNNFNIDMDSGNSCGKVAEAQNSAEVIDVDEGSNYDSPIDFLFEYPFVGGLDLDKLGDDLELGEVIDSSVTENFIIELQEKMVDCKYRRSKIRITNSDFDFLNPYCFINDHIIMLWMRWILRREDAYESDIFCLDSYLYTLMVDKGVEYSAGLYKNQDFRRFRYIYLPINSQNHWSLVVIVNPRFITTRWYDKIVEHDFQETKPCMVHLDSLKAHFTLGIEHVVRQWLNEVWKQRYNAKEDLFNEKNTPMLTPDAPCQKNSYDCGLFVCKYALAFYQLAEPMTIDNLNALGNKPPFLFQHDSESMSKFRKNIRTLLNRILAKYKGFDKDVDPIIGENERSEDEPAKKWIRIKNRDDVVELTKRPYYRTIDNFDEEKEFDEGVFDLFRREPKVKVPCAVCESFVYGGEICSMCQRTVHKDCSLSVSGEQLNECLKLTGIVMCLKCGANKKRSCMGRSVHVIKQSYGLIPEQLPPGDFHCQFWKGHNPESTKLYEFLNEVTHIGARHRSDGVTYYVGKRSGRASRVIPSDLMEDLFQFFARDFHKINKTVKRSQWYELKPNILQYIRRHCNTFLDLNKFEAMEVCETQEWSFIRVTTKDKCKDPIEGDIKFTDSLNRCEDDDAVWLSLTNNKKSARVPCVPLYFISKWRRNCQKGTNPEHENEVNIMLHKAKRNPNKWNKIECGRYRSVKSIHFPCAMDPDIPRSFRVQPFGENSCVFTSLINAMHYIGDYNARDQLVRRITQSINYSDFGTQSQTRLTFAAHVINTNSGGYIIRYMEKFNILIDRSMWPTVCKLKGSDGSTNHAITVVENYIFEGNCPHAILLTRQNLDWCCSSESSPNVKYVGVEEAHRYVKKNPSSNMLLRCNNKIQRSLNAIMHCFMHIGAYKVVPEIASLREVVDANSDILSIIVRTLKQKPLSYQVRKLNDLKEALLKGAKGDPVCLLLKGEGTFQYGIIALCDNLLFDGLSPDPLELSLENIYETVVSGNEDSVKKQLLLTKGYVFLPNIKIGRIKKAELSSDSSSTLGSDPQQCETHKMSKTGRRRRNKKLRTYQD